jgi:dsRNA-specific ribonuclease
MNEEQARLQNLERLVFALGGAIMKGSNDQHVRTVVEKLTIETFDANRKMGFDSDNHDVVTQNDLPDGA